MAANLTDRVCDGLTPRALSALADFVDERGDRVQRALAAIVPMVVGAFCGHAHQPGGLELFHAEVTGPHVDARLVERLPQHLADKRLSPILQLGHVVGCTLFGERFAALAPALAGIVGLHESSAAVMRDLATALVLGTLKRITLERRYDARQLGDLLAAQYVGIANRIDPALAQSQGHPSTAAWLSARGADRATRHPMARSLRESADDDWQLSSLAEQLAFLLLVVSVSVMIFGTLTPFRGGAHRGEARGAPDAVDTAALVHR